MLKPVKESRLWPFSSVFVGVSNHIFLETVDTDIIQSQNLFEELAFFKSLLGSQSEQNNTILVTQMQMQSYFSAESAT